MRAHKITKVLGIFLVVAVFIAGGLFGAWRLISSRQSNPIPQNVRQSAAFTLYYPTAAPAGYKFDPASIRNNGGTVLFSFTKAGAQPIVISQQAAPAGFDPKSMFQRNPPPTTISPLGTVYDLSYKNQSRYMLYASDSLIFISSSSKLTNQQLQDIVQGLSNG